MGRVLTLATLALLGAAAAALANGGPVAEYDTILGGGITPLERDDIALVEEKATIKVAGSAELYWVDARYVLRNAKGPKTLLFGVPIARDPAVVSDDLGIRIDVAGQSVPCQLRAAADLKSNPRLREDLKLALTPQGWCVATITVPQGDRVPLRLRYKDGTTFEDNEFSESRLADHHPRVLTYDVFPAGYWGSGGASVSIAVDVSALSGVPAAATPKPTIAAPERIEWQLRGEDLRSFGQLQVSFDMTASLKQRELLKLNKTITKPRARASSALVETGDAHVPLLVADGKGGSAWCAGPGAAGDGTGEWVELAFKPEVYDFGEGKETACLLEGFGVVPGYARLRSYKVYGRARRVRLSACGGGDPGADLKLDPVAETPERSAFTALELAEPLRAQLYECVRVTILESVPGTDHREPCIGEIIPVFNCESRGEPAKRRKPPF